MTPEKYLKEHELDVAGSYFGIKFRDGGAPNGLCDLYIEDDETWHYQCPFNHFWLLDLSQVVSNSAIKFAAKEKPEEPKVA